MGETTAIAWTERMKEGAQRALNAEVHAGVRPHPNAIPCAQCGHVWAPGERRHEYDHHRGYDRSAWFDVEAVCTLCHASRGKKARQAACIRGHALSGDNLYRNPNGTRRCRTCQRARDGTRNAARAVQRRLARLG